MKRLFVLLAILAPRVVDAQPEPDAPPESSGSSTSAESGAPASPTAAEAASQPSTTTTSTTSSTPSSATDASDAAPDPASAPVARFDRWQPRRLVVEIDACGDAETVRQDGPDLEQFRLGRAELGTTL